MICFVTRMDYRDDQREMDRMSKPKPLDYRDFCYVCESRASCPGLRGLKRPTGRPGLTGHDGAPGLRGNPGKPDYWDQLVLGVSQKKKKQ